MVVVADVELLVFDPCVDAYILEAKVAAEVLVMVLLPFVQQLSLVEVEVVLVDLGSSPRIQSFV